MNAGVADPMAFLSNADADWDIACAVVRRADEMRQEQRHAELKAVIDAIGKSVGNQVGAQIARMFR